MDVIKIIQFTDYTKKIMLVTFLDFQPEDFYLDHLFFDVFVMIPDINYQRFQMFEICRFCEKGADHILTANSWKYSQGFEYPLDLISSFRGNFYGTSLSMGLLMSYPNTYIIGNDSEGEPIYDGLFYRNYKILGQMLNVIWNITPPSDGNNWSFRTYVYDMLDGITDIVGGSWVVWDTQLSSMSIFHSWMFILMVIAL